jgi:hypothetical protein
MKVALASSLAKLAAQIKTEHLAVEQSLKAGVEHARHAGELLLNAKMQVKHGEWLPWLKMNCKISEWSAQSYMRIAARYEELKAKSGTVTDLSYRDALKLLADQPTRIQVEITETPPTTETTSVHTVVIPTSYYNHRDAEQQQPDTRHHLPSPVAFSPVTKAAIARDGETQFQATLVRLLQAYERDYGVRIDTIQTVRDEAGVIQQADLWLDSPTRAPR